MVSERIQDVFREVLGKDSLEITETTSKSDVPGWDSLADIKLIIGLEEEYGIKFTTREIGHLQSVGDFQTALESRGLIA